MIGRELLEEDRVENEEMSTITFTVKIIMEKYPQTHPGLALHRAGCMIGRGPLTLHSVPHIREILEENRVKNEEIQL